MAELRVLYNYMQGDQALSERVSNLEQMIDDSAGIGDTDKVWSADMTAKIERIMHGQTHLYGCLWNQTDATMKRLWNAKGITTETTNFTHNGSINPNYSNPFDNLMPWKGRKACNVDLTIYKAMMDAGEGNLTDCIKAYEGDANFDWNDADGVWVYTPEFWYTVYDREDGNRVFGVADGAVPGWTHAPESIQGRTFGVDETRTVGGENVVYLLPKAGSPTSLGSGYRKLERAQAYGGTIEDIYTLGEENMLYIVEFASMNSQSALGDGVSNFSCYREADQGIMADAAYTNTITVRKVDDTRLDVNGLLYVGTTYNNGSIARDRIITAVETNANDDTLYDVTFTGSPISVTTENAWCMYGLANPVGLDSALGSKSGYLGDNGKSNAYYRGKVSHANKWRYVLGAYHEGSTNHLLVNKRGECENTESIERIDTGAVWAEGDGIAKTLACVSGFGQLPVATELGGTLDKPVGDGSYNTNPENTTPLHVGATATYGQHAGRFADYVRYQANQHAAYGALPCLKNPAILSEE